MRNDNLKRRTRRRSGDPDRPGWNGGSATQRDEDDAHLAEVHRQMDGALREVVEVGDRELDLED